MSPTKRKIFFAIGLAALPALSGCATKKYVRQEVAVERDARVAADEHLSARITALRSDLDSLSRLFGARIVALEDGLLFVMPVTFGFNDANVSQQATPMLKRFARVANKYYPNSTITVEGFADPAGSERYNLALSRMRAENVGRALYSVGLTGRPVRAVGYGESRQVHPGAAGYAPGAQQNRRVVFVIENAGKEAAIALGRS
jgi:peptidoglycan-associated lipoprotein